MIIAVFEILGHDGDCGMGLLGFGEIAMAASKTKNINMEALVTLSCSTVWV